MGKELEGVCVKYIVIVVLLLVGIQFIPVNRDNPPFDKADEIEAPQAVMDILKKSCYDCHSNEVKYSIYSKVAPLSWGVKHHINEGREAINFSTWKQMDPKFKKMRVDRFANVLKLNQMPLPSYLLFHKESEISDAEKKTLIAWANGPLKESVEEELKATK